VYTSRQEMFWALSNPFGIKFGLPGEIVEATESMIFFSGLSRTLIAFRKF